MGDIGSSQSLNRYAYCEGNPVSLIDPFGLSPEVTQDQGQKSKYEKWHNALDLLGMFWDGADLVNAGLYAAEGQWGKAAVSMACALPFVGNVIAGATKATKFAKAGNIIGKTLQMAGKAYMTVQAASKALDLAGDARIEYAKKGGQVTLGVAAKTLGAIAMGTLAVMSGKDIISDTLNLSKLDAQNINFKTNSQETADNISGKNTKCNGVGECFTAGTKIKTADGEKNVEEVNTGDYVLAEDPETGEQEYKKVVHTFINVSWALVHVTVGDEEIETTIEHPFYVEGIGFVSAKDLQPGDIIRASDGRNLPIQKVEIEKLEEPVLGYNFEVEDYHTYYVSELGVLVHNNCSGETDFYVGPEGAATSLEEYDFYVWLNHGEANYKVYFGMKGIDAKYTGITRQTLLARLKQHNYTRKNKSGEIIKPGKGFSNLEKKVDGLTFNQARAIEQHHIENGPNELNIRNSISPTSNKYYEYAKKWAKQYIETNGR